MAPAYAAPDRPGDPMLARHSQAVLAALVAAAMLVATAGVLTVLDRAATAADDRRAAERVRAAELLAASLDGWSDGARAEVAGRAARAHTSLADVTVANPLLAFDPGPFDALYVVDEEGRVVGATAARAGLVGLERSARVVLAARSGEVAGPVLLVDGLTRRLEVTTAAPMPGGEVLVGVVDVEGSRPWRALQTAAGTRNAPTVTLVDPEGHLLRTGADPTESILLDAEVAPAASRAPDGAGVHTYPGEGEVRTVGAYAPFGDGWAAVLTQPEADFLAGSRTHLLPLGVAMALLSLAAAAAVAGLERRRSELAASVDGTKRAILAVAGHELRTPLTVIKGMMGLLLKRGPDLPPERHHEIVEVMSAQTDKLEYLLERIIAVGHLASGQHLAGASREVDVVATTRRAVDYQRTLAPNHAIELRAPDDPVTVRADQKVLRDTVVHLIDNAVRYSPGGGAVTVTVERARGEMRLHVEDRGIGLPPSRRDLFEPFTQGQEVDTRVEDEGGLGMGLALVAAAVGEFGGSVGITDREDGRGVRATVRIPLSGSGRALVEAGD